ncbi:type IV secretory system conjugative DNA transfer family protein (plasmid) [Acinetobacter soli]|nr:type IV secretory system conjugative DNA transfer family protein [Acinetobacter soli]
MSYKTTKQTYKILKQARFSTRAPDWRQYLVFPTLDSNVDYVTFIPKEMLPANEQERKIWKETAAKSYEMGLVEGRNIVEDAVDRLKRDYLGMVTFHKFVLEGKLSMPAISSQSLAVSSTQDTIALDMKLLQIQQLPQFNSNIETWKPILQPEQIAPSYQIPKLTLLANLKFANSIGSFKCK